MLNQVHNVAIRVNQFEARRVGRGIEVRDRKEIDLSLQHFQAVIVGRVWRQSGTRHRVTNERHCRLQFMREEHSEFLRRVERLVRIARDPSLRIAVAAACQTSHRKMHDVIAAVIVADERQSSQIGDPVRSGNVPCVITVRQRIEQQKARGEIGRVIRLKAREVFCAVGTLQINRAEIIAG